MALDVKFHDLIYQAARHKRLYESWCILRTQTQVLLLTANVANPDFAMGTFERHAEVLDAVRSRNIPEAIRVMEDHLRWTYIHAMKWYRASETRDITTALPGIGQRTSRPLSDLLPSPHRLPMSPD
jgi:DNA-binding GntR family transcriptional regulator